MLLLTARTKRLMLLVLVLASSLLVADRAEAQVVPPYGQFQPLNQYLTPGTAGHWAALAGKKHDFPIPIYIDRDDIESAIKGNLVTRVVYIEQPQLAAPFALDESTRVRTLLPAQNVLAQADRYGRPAVIVRIGGRLPSVHGERAAFYGTGGIVSTSRPSVPPPNAQQAPYEQLPNTPAQPAELKSSVPQNGSTPE
jgi:hypothetical protein